MLLLRDEDVRGVNKEGRMKENYMRGRMKGKKGSVLEGKERKDGVVIF